MPNKTLRCAILPVLCLALSCVAETAGYGDVQRLTSSRLRTQARWNEVDGSPAKEVHALLAKPMTAALAGQIAVLNSPRLQAEFERLGIARAAWVSALRLPNPSVSGALVYGIDPKPEVDLDASLNLTSLIQLGSRDGIANAELQATVQDVANMVLDIAFEAKRAFVEYQIASAELSLRETITHSWLASAGMAKELFELGNVTELRSANEQAFFEEVRVQQARGSARVNVAREQVNAALGLWGPSGAQWTMADGTLPAPIGEGDVEELVRDLEVSAVRESFGVKAARLRFEASAKRANLATFSGWFPQVHAGVRVARQQPEGGPAKWGAGPMVEVGVPLFYQGQGESAQAAAEMRRHAALIDDLAIRTRSASRAATSRLKTAAQMARHYKERILPLRGQVVEQTQLQYNAMSIGVFELLQAKNMEIAAHLAYLDIVKDYSLVRLDAEQLRAGGLVNQNPWGGTNPQSVGMGANAATHD
jgi:cobalt-zinc-cadmium efflux system outer membrane protein